MIKKITIIAVLIAFILSGCSYSDYTEPEKRIIVTALLLKKELKNFNVILETVDVKNSEKGEEFIAEYIIGEAENLGDAMYNVQSEASKKISLYHCPLIICDSKTFELYKNEIYDYLIGNQELSLAANLVITDSLNDFIDAEKENTIFLGYEITDILELKNAKTDIIDLLRGREQPCKIVLDKDNKYILSES